MGAALRSVDRIPTYRQAHFALYLQFLRQAGVCLDAKLRDARLPSSESIGPDARLPLRNVSRLLADVARSESIDDLGLRAKASFSSDTLSPILRSRVKRGPTLLNALQSTVRFVYREVSALTYWLTYREDSIFVCSVNAVTARTAATRCFEYGSIQPIVAIVRAYAGNDWSPTYVGLQSRGAVGRFAEEAYPNTRFVTGQTCNWVSMPRSLLALSPSSAHTGTPEVDEEDAPDDWVESLRSILASYLSDGRPGVEVAAEIAGTSTRTLQRRLRESGLSYSELLEQVWFAAAAEQLGSSDDKVIDIAHQLGWEDPSHFTRAFRRLSGMTPKQYCAFCHRPIPSVSRRTDGLESDG